MTDYMIDCATKKEWAERALVAEARNKELALELLAVHTQAQEANDKLAKAADIDLIEQCIRDVLDEGGTIRSAAEYVARATLAEIKGE